MNCKVEIKMNEIIDIDTIKFKISKPTNCGFCGNGIDPKVISYSLIDDSYHAELYVFMECPVCNEIFICVYPFSEDDLTFDSMQTHGYSKILGEGLLNEKFSEEINDISPKFVTIYNEAYRAEQMGLKILLAQRIEKPLNSWSRILQYT